MRKNVTLGSIVSYFFQLPTQLFHNNRIVTFRRLVMCVAMLLCCGLVQQAKAQGFGYSYTYSTATISRIDNATGALTTVYTFLPATPISQATALAVDLNGDVYFTDNQAAGAKLYKFVPNVPPAVGGTLTLVGTIPATFNDINNAARNLAFGKLAINPSGALFTISNYNLTSANNLPARPYIINLNKATAGIVSVNDIPTPTGGVRDLPVSGGDLDFSPTGRLFVSGTVLTTTPALPSIWEINATTGSILAFKSVVQPAGTNFTNISGLGFDLQGNVIGTCSSPNNYIIKILAAEFSGNTSWSGNAVIPGSAVSLLNGPLVTSYGDMGGNAFRISGQVFEDVNYGGGAGRPFSTAGTAGIPGARVEVYNSAGMLQNFTTSQPDGTYSIGVSGNGIFYIRIVNGTLSSTRPGNTGAELGVQTFRSDAVVTGTVVNQVNEVGGRSPATTDPGTGTIGTTTLNTTTFVLSGGVSGTAESVSQVTIGTAGVQGINFGYNFSTIVNVNNTGQGSLRQFILNSNLLTNAGLDQVANSIFDPAAGVETSIFMIPDGASHPGINKPNQLTAAGGGNTALFSVSTLLPVITDAATSIDGRTQTANIGNSQPGVAGHPGNTVGVGAIALPGVNRPEVELRWTGPALTGTYGLSSTGSGTIIRSLAVDGFGGATGSLTSNIASGGANVLITENIIGGSAISTNTEGAGTNPCSNILFTNTASVGNAGSITNNIISRADYNGIYIPVGILANNLTISGNEILNNGNGANAAGILGTNAAGIAIAHTTFPGTSDNNSVINNSIANNGEQGLQVIFGNGLTVTNNTFSTNGALATPVGAQLIQLDNIGLINTENSVTSQNIVTAAASSGISVAGPSAISNKISQNSTYNNAQLGINLNPSTTAISLVTPNDNGDVDTGPNGLLNFPVITGAVIVGTNLVVKGFSGAGNNIELFIADRNSTFSPTPPFSPNPLPAAYTDRQGFGEGRQYLMTIQEGSGSDQDATTGTYMDDGTGVIGPRTANRFQFTIPLSSISGVALNTLLTATATDAANNTSEFNGTLAVTYGDMGDAPDSYTTLAASNGPVHVLNPKLQIGAINTGEIDAHIVAAGSSANLPNGDPSDDGLPSPNPLPPLTTATTLYNVTLPVTNTTGVTANLAGWIDFNRNNVFDADEYTIITVPNGATTATLSWLNASSLITGNGINGINGGLTYARFRLTTDPLGSASINGVASDGEVEDYSCTINRAYDLSITKTASPSPAVAGSPLTYTLTVTNNGASAMVALDTITVTDILPAGFTASTYVPAAGVYNSATNKWSGLTLTSGQSTTLTISGTLSPTATGSLLNTAIVKTPPAIVDANINNDTTRLTTPISRILDLSLAKTASPKPAVAGSPFTYTITLTNNGPASLLPADITTLTDNLPTGFTATTYTPSAGTYTSGNGQWTGLTLATGQSATLNIVGTIAANYTGTSLVNIVTATPPTGTTDPTPPSAKDSTVVGRVVDLDLTKVGSPKPAVAGQAFTYTVTLTNNGPSSILPADVTTITDNLPTGFTATSYTPSAGTYTSGNGQWTGLTLATGQSATLTIAGSIAANYTGTSIVNTITATPPPGTTDPTPPTGKDSTVVGRVVDLNLTKVGSPKPAVAGQAFTYTITLSNAGPSSILPADVTTITDNLPTGFTASSYTASAGTYTSGTGQWTGLTLATGQSATLTIVGSIAANYTGTSIVNTITATPPTGTTDPTPPTGKDSTTVSRVIDLSLNKTASPKPAVAGQTLTYTITLSNAGPGTVVPGDTVVVTDNLPAGFTASSYAVSAGTYNSATGQWTGQTLPTGQTATLTIIGTVAANYTGASIINTVTATPPTGTTDPTPPTSTDTTTVSRVIDLSLNKTASPKPAVAGQTLTYTITLSNAGPGTVVPGDTVVVTDNLPSGFTASSYAVSAGTYNSTTGQWTGQTLATGQTATLTIVGTVAANYTGTSIVNTITATPPTGTTDPTPPTSTDSTTVSRILDLVLAKTASPKPAVAGSPLTYTITLTNNGPAILLPGDTVTLTDNVPAGFTASGYTASAGTYNSTTGKWTGQTLSVGQSATITIAGTVNANYTGNSLINTVTGTPPTGTTDPTPPTGTDTTTVNRVIDFSLSKTSSPNPAVIGQALTYTITLSNAGPGAMVPGDTITLTDNLPAGFTANTYTPATGTYNSATGQWTGFSLPVGQSITLTIAGTVSATYTGTSLVNTVTVTPPTGTTDPTPPTGKDSTGVSRIMDLVLVKTASPKPAVAGQALTYTITLSNNGPAVLLPADVVTLTDNLPAGFTASSFVASAGTYNSSNGQWTGQTLNVGQSATITITGTVNANYTGTSLINTVTGTPPTGTTDPTPPTSTDTTVVNRVIDFSLNKTSSPRPAVAGQALTYTITLSNAGPGDLVPGDTLTVVDNLPVGFTANTFTAATGTYNSTTGKWTGISLTAGQSTTLTIAGTVSASYTGTTLTNTVTAIPPTGTTDPTPPTSTDTTTVSRILDLVLAKTASPKPVVAGRPLTYTITLTNNGPATLLPADVVTLTDNLPAGFTASSYTASAGTYNSGNGQWNGLTLTVGQGATITIAGMVSPADTATLINTVTGTPPPGTTDPTPPTATDVTPVILSGDLAITKTDGTTTYTPGTNSVYTIVVSNNGPSNVVGATVSDPLPAGIITAGWTATAGAGASVPATSGAGAINQIVSIPAGSNITYTLTLTVPSGFTGNLTNTATVTPPAGYTDSIPGNNTATDIDTMNPQYSLTASKTAPASVNAGTGIKYTITYVNNGPSDLMNALLTDTVAASLTGITWTATTTGTASVGTTSGGGNNKISLTGSLPAGAGNTIVVTINGTVPSSTTGTLMNVAWITPPGKVPPVPSNITSTTVTNLTGINIVKMGPLSGTVSAGSIVTYNILVTNQGPSDAVNLAIADVVPGVLTGVTWVATAGGRATITGGSPFNGTGNNVSVTADIPAGAGNQVTIAVTGTLPSATVPGTISNFATATPVGGRPDTSQVMTRTTNDPVFVISKTGPSTINAGSNISYTLTITNTGLSDAKNAVITDNIPVEVQGAAWVTTTTGTANIVSGGTGSGNAVGVTVNIPAGAGNKVTIVVTGKVDPATVGTMTNTAKVTYPGKPDVPSNTVTTTITNAPGLHLDKSGPAVISAGKVITYTLVLTNSGPSNASSAKIVDTLVSQLSNIHVATAVTGTANVTANTLVGNVVNVTGNIDAGAGNSIAVTITGTIDPAFAGTITNTAQVGIPGNPPVPANPVPTVVTNDPGIHVNKSGPASINAGQQITYTMEVTNSGPSNATNVAIVDAIPAKVLNPAWTAVATGTGTSVSTGSGNGNINITGNIPAGAGNMITVTVTGKVDPGYTGTLVNTISAGVTGNPPAIATSTTSVINKPDVRIIKSGPSTVKAGQAISYTILATNNGPSDASNVVINDVMPAGLINVNWTATATGTGTTVNKPNGTGNVNVTGNIPGGAGHEITILVVGTVDPAFTGGSLANTAVANPPGQPPVPSDTIKTPVTVSPDLKIVKSGPDNASAGAQVTYTIDVTNSGPSNAVNVAITDMLSAKLLLPVWTVTTTGTSTTASPLNGSGNVSVNGNIPAGAGNKITITVSGKVDPAATGTLTNTATATVTGQPPVSAVKNTNITNDPVIQITKSGPGSAAAGQQVRYMLQITNSGLSDATNVAIADNIPAGLENVTWTAAGSDVNTTVSPAGGTGNVSATANIPAGTGHEIVVTITGTVGAAFTGATLNNTATATAPGKTPATSTVVTKVRRVSDIQIVKSGPQQIVAGEQVTYNIIVTNQGPSNVLGAGIQDIVPADLQNVSWAAVANGTGTTVSAPSGTGNTINVTGNIPATTGNNITIVVSGRLNPATTSTTVVNTATVTPPAGTIDPTPPSSTVTSTVTKEADLVIVKTGPADKAAGQPITYKLVITNNGPSSVTGATIKDVIPSQITGITFNTSTTGTAAVTASALAGHTLNITGNIQSGAGNSIIVNINGIVDPATPPGSFINTATVTPPTGVTDKELTNNTSSITTKVNTDLGIQISKSGPAVTNVRDSIRYTIEISNTGVSDALNGIITDNVPPEITGVSWSAVATGSGNTLIGTGTPTGTTLSGTGNNISFVANIESGGTGMVLLTIRGVVSPAAGLIITNTASALFSGIKQSTFTTATNKTADLHIVKAGPSTIGAGQQITYTIDVTNSGPADALGSLIQDNVPAAIQNVSWTATAFGTASLPVTSGSGSNTLVINANLPAGMGNGVRITVSGNVDAAYTGGPLVNTATATPPPGIVDLTPSISTVSTTVTNVPGLQIMKSGPATISAGQKITYTVRVKNNGPSDVANLTINDPVAAHILNPTWTATANGTGAKVLTGATGSGMNVLVTGSLLGDKTSDIEIIISGTVDLAFSGPITNVATVTPTGGTPITSPPVTTQVTNKPGLQIMKSGPATISAGQEVTYTVEVTNNGPSDAKNVTITDLVPAQVEGVSWTTSAAGATILTGNTGNVSNVLVTGNITAGAGNRITITIRGTVNQDYRGLITNTATASITGGTPVTSSVNTVVNSKTGLNIMKSGPETIVAGQRINYTIDVTNAGPSRAGNITINDLVPANIQMVTWTAVAQGTGTSITSGNTGTGNSINITGNISAGAGNIITIQVAGTVYDTATGVLTNIAQVTVPGGVPVVSPPVITQVTNKPGLIINKSAPSNALSNDKITYTVRVTNVGPSAATGAVITDNVPAGINDVSWTTSTTGGAVIQSGRNGTGSNVSVTANIPAGEGNEVIINITGKIAPDYNGALKNVAKVTPPGGKPIPTDTSTTSVKRTADIRVVKSGPAIVAAGGEITYTVDISNEGPADVSPVTITDIVPAAITVSNWKVVPVSGISTITNPTSGTGNNITIQASLNSKAEIRLTVTGIVKQGTTGQLTNTANATLPANVVDPTPDNSSTVVTTVVNQSGVKLVKTGPSTVKAGESITYDIVATNAGPSDASNVQIMDDVPAQLTGITWKATTTGNATVTVGATGTGRNVNVTGNIGAGEGSSIQITITAMVPADASGDLSNVAIAKIPGVPVNPTTPPVTTVVTKDADLQITKSGPATIIQGRTITYVINVKNNGPASANGATLKDVVPAGISAIVATVTDQTGGAAGTVLNVNGNTVTGTMATLPPGAEVGITIKGTVNGTATLNNIASVSPPSGVIDPTPGNNTTPPVITTVTSAGVPVANDDMATTNENTPVIIPVLANDKGGNGTIDPATIVIVTQTLHGQAAVNPDGTVTYTPDPGYTGPDTFTYTVKDSNGAVSNVATVFITVLKTVDLAVVKTVVTAGPYKVGQQIIYSIAITNNGPGTATGVFTTDVLPSSMSVPTEITAAKGMVNFDITSSAISWNIGTLNPGESSVLTFMVRLTASGDISNKAVISGNEPDINPANNVSIVTIPVSGDIFIPNVITPNGDGKNDRFVIPNLNKYPGTGLFIYNRWGNMVYQSKDYDNKWDGHGLSEGTYYYILKLNTPQGIHDYKGWIEIMR
jgi:gliding motility-associated-like protein/uncharacterized repeat protein (TIGR01451 family)